MRGDTVWVCIDLTYLICDIFLIKNSQLSNLVTTKIRSKMHNHTRRKHWQVCHTVMILHNQFDIIFLYRWIVEQACKPFILVHGIHLRSNISIKKGRGGAIALLPSPCSSQLKPRGCRHVQHSSIPLLSWNTSESETVHSEVEVIINKASRTINLKLIMYRRPNGS